MYPPTKTFRPSSLSHSLPRRCLGWASLFLLALPVPILALSEEAASRAELEMLRQEIQALRTEVERLRAAFPKSPEVVAPQDPVAPEAQPETPKSVATWNRSLLFTAPDGRASLQLGGRIQPRYEYERRENAANLSSFFIRRIRLDFRGHASTPDLTYRIIPELARTASLRDGYINYRRQAGLEIRFGQFSVPFGWERDVSSSRHQFVERSLANGEFEWKDGRDLGVMVHGKPHETLRYGIGLFGGEGQNVRRTTTDGHLFTTRITYAAQGEFPESEALVQPVPEQNLSFGLGLGYANKNAARDWHPWSPGSQTAQVFTATADAHLQMNRFSNHLIGFYRDVDTRHGAPSYDGFGATLQAGYLILPDRLFGSIRFGYSEPNTGETRGKERELLLGFQLFQFGHNAKMHFEVGRLQSHNDDTWLDADIFRTQYQLLF
jgi:hypothetical protein